MTGWAAVILGGLGLLGALGASYALFRYGDVKAQLDGLRQRNVDLRAELADKDRQLGEIRSDRDQLAVRVSALELVVTGRAELQQIIANQERILTVLGAA